MSNLKQIIEESFTQFAEWYFEEYPDGYYHYTCSNCEMYISEEEYKNQYKYCPYCGFKIIEQNEDEKS